MKAKGRTGRAGKAAGGANGGSPREVRLGIIGVGQIGKAHLANYANIAGVKVVAAADVDMAEARRVAAAHGIGDVYADFRELLARGDVEAVDVCLHNNLHSGVTCAALKAGKHVYCEKPMAGSYRDAAAMLETARSTGLKLSIQLNTLFSPETRAARQIIEAGELGELYHARSTGFRRRGRPFVDGYGTSSFVRRATASGGALYDMGVYHIARMLHLLGNPAVERVSGKTYQKTGMDEARRKESRYDVEELGLGFVRFAGGLTMDVIEAWALHMDRLDGSCVVGSRGGIRLDPFGFFRPIADLDCNCTTDLKGAAFRWATVRGLSNQYDSPQHHWIAALRGQVDLLPTAEIALNTMLISEAIYRSEELGREVTADEVVASSRSTAIRV
jgi:predicted dehydrogenase